MRPIPTSEAESRRFAHIVYGLQALGFFTGGLTFVAAVVVNYVKREDVGGWIASHFRWQIRTFWYGLAWGALGALTVFVGVGIVVLYADAIWLIYRIVKGWLRLSEEKAMYVPPPTSSGAA